MKSVRVTVPATAANLGPGFDALALAVSLRNEVTLQAAGRMRPSGDTITCVTVDGYGAGKVPVGRTNLVVRAALRVFAAAKRVPERLSVRLRNRIPLGSGLGSSAAGTIGGLLAANALCGEPLSHQRILEMATKMEGHPDNAAAALHGGLTICAMGARGRVHVLQSRVRKDLTCVFCVPEKPVETRKARAALPKTYRREDVVFSLSRAAMLSALLQGGGTDLFSVAMEDRLHQPRRAKLMPGIAEAMDAAVAAGALGACISGVGPAVLAFAGRRGQPDAIAQAMTAAFLKAGTEAKSLVLGISRNGARVTQA